MDFLRRSFLPWEETSETLPDRWLAGEASPFRPPQFPAPFRITMLPALELPCEPSGDAPANDSQLHAALRDVPLPPGFMSRVRQFVAQRWELPE